MPPSPSSIRREFLDWSRPALAEAAQRLLSLYRNDSVLDLGNVIVVIPGQCAGRRLQELLALLVEENDLLLTPPRVVTEGRLAEMLYVAKLPFANDIVQDLAWAKAVREMPAEQRRHIIPRPPPDGEALRWLQLGKTLRRVHVELAADGLDFSAVQQCGPKLSGFAENKALGSPRGTSAQLSGSARCEELWDIQTAGLKAIEFHEVQSEATSFCSAPSI